MQLVLARRAGLLLAPLLVVAACAEGTARDPKRAPVNHRGNQAVAGRDSFVLTAGDGYFEPTVLEGSAGGRVTLEVVNDGEERHNFTLQRQGIAEDVAPGRAARIVVRFPFAGSFTFYCKYHASEGMRGSLYVAE